VRINHPEQLPPISKSDLETAAGEPHVAGGELIVLALRTASPVVVMTMSVPAHHRAVEHFTLLWGERLIERFERRLRRLESLSPQGGNSAELGLPLHDGRVRAGLKRALLAQRAPLIRARSHGIAPFVPERALIRRQFKLDLKIGETRGEAGIPLRAVERRPIRPRRLRLGLSWRGRAVWQGLREG